MAATTDSNDITSNYDEGESGWQGTMNTNMDKLSQNIDAATANTLQLDANATSLTLLGNRMATAESDIQALQSPPVTSSNIFDFAQTGVVHTDGTKITSTGAPNTVTMIDIPGATSRIIRYDANGNSLGSGDVPPLGYIYCENPDPVSGGMAIVHIFNGNQWIEIFANF